MAKGEPLEEPAEELMPTPIIELDPEGQASVIRHHVPEPVSFTGQCVIELPLPGSCLAPAVAAKPDGATVQRRLHAGERT